jgi:hypothetical protein
MISCAREPGPLDLHLVNERSTEERNRPNLLDLRTEDQQPLDLEVSAQELTLVCVGEWTRQSPKVPKSQSEQGHSIVQGGRWQKI